ncbi:hypothetical protein P22_1677 [Propionispora sp. 2/2-37]|uniref:YceD family protein n=1 Tax=Propionispora sp. 2/2-37 TaxID=1677858 RepID=UPI0006BB9202|nr:YceD family protein [Propionispora sp. 2/2-37]CUH95603.1 hypothetical protein P22_1677 [Propionispora sp. 2/2-37]
MKINISQAKKEIGSRQPFVFTLPVNSLQLEQLSFTMISEVTVTGDVVNKGRVLEVAGIIHADAVSFCDRCLAEFQFPLDIVFQEEFQESAMQATDELAEVSTYQGDEIELNGLVEDNIALAEPLQTVCSPDCRGLCPKCGTNLNVAACMCDRTEIDPRLAKLQQLLKNNP